MCAKKLLNQFDPISKKDADNRRFGPFLKPKAPVISNVDSSFSVPFTKKINISQLIKKWNRRTVNRFCNARFMSVCRFFEATQHNISWYFHVFRNHENSVLYGFCAWIVFSGLWDTVHIQMWTRFQGRVQLNVNTDVNKIQIVHIWMCTKSQSVHIQMWTDSDLFTSGVQDHREQSVVHISSGVQDHHEHRCEHFQA